MRRAARHDHLHGARRPHAAPGRIDPCGKRSSLNALCLRRRAGRRRSRGLNTMPTIQEELSALDPEISQLASQRDSTAHLLDQLPLRFAPAQVAEPGPSQRTWELAGLVHLAAERYHEALAIFRGLYQQMLAAQEQGQRVHKGMPLVWISDCFLQLGCPVHAKRYLLLTLCEDAIQEQGVIAPDSTGSYFRLVWRGLPDHEFRRYAERVWKLSLEHPQAAMFPEALLQRLDDAWLTEVPSATEAFVYVVNERYVHWLLGQLGDGTGKALELLAQYLLSCMPGCRTRRRQISGSTDYDVVCSMEGFDVDFRSELGRYFVCECKDWAKAADFTTMAKFCRVLDSFKARFGILFSKAGISGEGSDAFAALEQIKVFQDRGIVIVVIDHDDLESVASGANLTWLLRTRYEAVRLDIRTDGS
jgi:hypothetical protein